MKNPTILVHDKAFKELCTGLYSNEINILDYRGIPIIHNSYIKETEMFIFDNVIGVDYDKTL